MIESPDVQGTELSDADAAWERETWERAVLQATSLISKARELTTLMRQLEAATPGDTRVASAREVLRLHQQSFAESKADLQRLMADETSTANDRLVIEQHLQMLSLVEDELAGETLTRQ